MNINDLKAGPEADLLVAEAVGIDMFKLPGADWWYRDDPSSPGNAVRFCPTTDMNHTKEAAEKVGLFVPDRYPATLTQVGTRDGFQWELRVLINHVEQSFIGRDLCVVFCKAILAIKK